MKLVGSILAVMTGSVLMASAEPDAHKLTVGDPAPKLQTGRWIQGEPMKELAGGKAYIVEFWATWCFPCKMTIPHLNRLHQQFKKKGLVVIGQNIGEKNDDAVEPFVKGMGERMTYRVALDDKTTDNKGAMSTTWMSAAGINGIPTAFIVSRDGHIAWIGSPAAITTKLLEGILADKFDIKKAVADFERKKKNEAEMAPFWEKFAAAMQQQKWEDAESSLASIEKLASGEDELSDVDAARFDVEIARKNSAAAHKLARGLSDRNPDNALLQNALAWVMLTAAIEKRDLPLAEKIASRAVEASGGGEPMILNTLARAQFMNGKKKQAVATMEKAVELVDDAGMKEAFKKTLASYREDKLPQ